MLAQREITNYLLGMYKKVCDSRLFANIFLQVKWV